MDLDVTSLLEAALQQGIWAALYIYLFFRMLKENASREERYQNMIDRLSSNIENGIENIDWMRWKNDMQVDKKRRWESLLFLYPKSKKERESIWKKS